MDLFSSAFSRRSWLQTSSCGMAYVAFSQLAAELAAESNSEASTVDENNPLGPKAPHHEPTAKRMIFLHMRGGPAHMDTFEYKPELKKRHGKLGKDGKRKIVGSPWKWKQRGESGLWVSDLVHHQAEHADDLCVLSGMHTDISNHTPAMLFLHTGSFAFTRPSMGSWLLYGLGTENQNLPGFISLCPPVINGGTKNYGPGFLPAVFQGTSIGDIKTNIAKASIGNIRNQQLDAKTQRSQLDLIQSLNQQYKAKAEEDSRIDGVIQSLEVAYRMQTSLPAVMDLAQESQETLDLYGIGDGKPSDNFGRQCLLARRMIESGVRHVELCDEFWDQHTALKKGHESRAAATDQGIGALLTDLKRRGLFDDTLVVWGGEFGRTPDTGRGDLDGRDHNANGYSMWLAGGGVRGGSQYGATDELGYASVEGRTHLHDLHATILHLMGLDHTKLTYRYAGRDFRLTDVHGRVVRDVLKNQPT